MHILILDWVYSRRSKESLTDSCIKTLRFLGYRGLKLEKIVIVKGSKCRQQGISISPTWRKRNMNVKCRVSQGTKEYLIS